MSERSNVITRPAETRPAGSVSDHGEGVIEGLVSIIIPTYNRALSVVEAINSAKAQTYSPTQIVVIDDGSSDDTARRVAGMEGVEYYYQPNKGQGAARNQGLRQSKGEFIASLDSDDLWERDFLTESVGCLERLKLDFVFTNWNRVRSERVFPSEWLARGKWKPYRTDPRGEWFLLTPAQVKKMFLDICPAPSSSLVVRRGSIISGWGERMQIADDWYLILEMALHRPCRAAFTLTPRWTKRVDGQNIYDGRPPAEVLKKLCLHDQKIFREEFGARLTRSEKLRLVRRGLRHRVSLSLREALRRFA